LSSTQPMDEKRQPTPPLTIMPNALAVLPAIIAIVAG
jgi:hypothetical protein